MSIGQIIGLVLTLGVFVGLIAYREWEERRQASKDRAGTAPASDPRRERQGAVPRP